MNRRGFEFSFAWMFAIIVGAVILFLALYAGGGILGTTREEIDSTTAAQLATILNPLETSLESSKYYKVSFSEETRIYTSCSLEGNFGRQGISTAVKSDIGEEWKLPGAETSNYNKYFFTNKIIQGRDLHFFAVPFSFPYKVSDIMVGYDEEYCFISPPEIVKEEIEALDLPEIKNVVNRGECGDGEKEVCFEGSGCDIDVTVNEHSYGNGIDSLYGTVSKNTKKVYFEGPLIYGAIFSDADLYECQTERIMKRAAELAQLYAAKGDFLSGKGCGGSLGPELVQFAETAKISNSEDLVKVEREANELRRRNELLACKLF